MNSDQIVPGLTVWLVVAMALTAARPAAALDLERLLAQPLSSGTIGLLIIAKQDPRVEPRLRAGLSHSDPLVRRAAARVISAGGVRSLAAAALEQLKAESDLETAIELIRAVAFNTNARHDKTLIEYAQSFGPVARSRIASILAWARGEAALEYVPDIGRVDAAAYDTTFLATAGRGGHALTRLAARALRERDRALWRALLAATELNGYPLDSGVLRVGLAADELRSDLLWTVATASGKLLPAHAAAAKTAQRQLLILARETSNGPAAATPDARFALAALARRLGEPPLDDATVLAALGAAEVLPIDSYLAAVGSRVPLSEKEHAALRERATRLGKRFSVPTLSGPSLPAADAATQPVEPPLPVRTPAGFPNGFVEGVLRAAGCRPSGRYMLAASVAYEPTGRVARATMGPSSMARPCQDAFEALVLASFQHMDSMSAPQQELVLMMRRDVLTCLAQPEPLEAAVAVGAGLGDIKPPSKTHDERLQYPANAIAQRAEGLVVIEGTISATGCIKDLRLIGSAHPLLNAAALSAVSSWRFTPTLVDGRAAPVMMTITMNFALP